MLHPHQQLQLQRFHSSLQRKRYRTLNQRNLRNIKLQSGNQLTANCQIKKVGKDLHVTMTKGNRAIVNSSLQNVVLAHNPWHPAPPEVASLVFKSCQVFLKAHVESRLMLLTNCCLFTFIHQNRTVTHLLMAGQEVRV